MELEIRPAYDSLPQVRALLDEYISSLGVDLSFQNYRAEYESLPGRYAPPDGRLYLACCDGQAAGVVALRRFDGCRGEAKRLFVRPAFRRRGIAAALMERLLCDARAIGYEAVLLDTSRELAGTVELYRKLGFYETVPYYHNPHPDTVYFRRELCGTAQDGPRI